MRLYPRDFVRLHQETAAALFSDETYRKQLYRRVRLWLGSEELGSQEAEAPSTPAWGWFREKRRDNIVGVGRLFNPRR